MRAAANLGRHFIARFDGPAQFFRQRGESRFGIIALLVPEVCFRGSFFGLKSLHCLAGFDLCGVCSFLGFLRFKQRCVDLAEFIRHFV